MRTITVPNPQRDSLIMQLASLYVTFKDVSADEDVVFDLSQVTWISPVLITPISAYLKTSRSQLVEPASNSYLKSIQFPKGLSSLSEFRQDSNYIPLSVLQRHAGVDREHTVSVFSNLIFQTLDSIPGAQNAVCYPISELAANIFEHSKEEEGFIFAQFYPKKGFLDLCIVDRGRGLARAYKEEKGLNLSDQEAISEAMCGRSTKPGDDRGYGVRTSKRVVCEGLKGQFIIISGTGALVVEQETEKLVSMPGFNWRGVIIAYRIPKPVGAIDIIPYLE